MNFKPGKERYLARLQNVSLYYKATCVLDSITLDIPSGKMVGLIGPDGVGKSSMLSLISGARKVQKGSIEVLGGNIKNRAHRRKLLPKIAYLPQGLGKNLYSTLTVNENVDYFGSLFGLSAKERASRIKGLLESTGLSPYTGRPAAKLSGGMKQKLGLCCALIHDPDILILDEPTTGIDPLSRKQFWSMISEIREYNPEMGVIVATAYMKEAEKFDWIIAMDSGRILSAGTPGELMSRTSTTDLNKAFIKLLPEDKRLERRAPEIIPIGEPSTETAVIEARDLTKKFGDFVAVNKVNFSIKQGEIFGFLGSNGCGKTTTMKMLTGLLEPSGGKSWLFGSPLETADVKFKKRIGYMSQGFSLYSELSVRKNLELHARLFHVPRNEIKGRIEKIADRFDLKNVLESLPDELPVGQRQRLSLGVALIHKPDILILDEPTSGVDPIARDKFWQSLLELSRRDRVTIFISTHFMNEAERCDRISFMHEGRVLVSGTPTEILKSRVVNNMEDAFISYLEETRSPGKKPLSKFTPALHVNNKSHQPGTKTKNGFTGSFLNFKRVLSCSKKESIELYRDPIRLIMAMLGTVILMFVMGYGISMDVEDIPYSILDRDRTITSNDYALNLSGSRYFIEHSPLTSYSEIDRRMRSGELGLVIEIPNGFARDLSRGRNTEIGAWIDGSMPSRAETVLGFVQGMHSQWLLSRDKYGATYSNPSRSPELVETRFRYNPNVESLASMVPAVIPLLLLFIPAMIAALSVVREKELGSIVNLYVTPVSKLEFILGKQLPYIALGMFNFLMLFLLAVTVFDVPIKGSFSALISGAFLYVISTVSIGLLISTFMKKQIAAIFGTSILTMLPAVGFSGLIDPVSSLQGIGAFIGMIYPTTHFLTISRGTFSKSLGFEDLTASFIPLLIAVPVLLFLCTVLLKKQEK